MEDKTKEKCGCENQEETCCCGNESEGCSCENESGSSCENEQPEDEVVEEIPDRIEGLEIEIEKLKNDYAKAYADTENMRKRLQNEFDQSKKYRIQSFALDILPVIDNLERALAAPTTEETESYRKGVEMIYNQLIHALEKEGVEEIDAEGKSFDANFHQALMSEVVEGIEPEMVIDVLQKGYKLKDRILRASMVKVSE